MFQSVIAVASIVVPVFGLVGLGFGSARTRLLKPAVGEGLAEFVFVIALPVLLFRTLARADIGDVSPWPFWVCYFLGVALVWAAGEFMVRRFFGRDARTGLAAAVAAAFGNVVMIGVPFVLAALGEAGSVPVATLIAVQLPVMMVASTLLVQRAERLDGIGAQGFPVHVVLRRVAGSLARNPLVIGIVAGALWRLTGLEITGVVATLMNSLIAAAVPCALFALGMSLATYRVGGNVAPAVAVAALKLFALPAAVYLLVTTLTDLPPIWVTVATLCAACPTGVNAWLIANRIGAGHELSANVITLSTALATVTMTGWLAFLTH